MSWIQYTVRTGIGSGSLRAKGAKWLSFTEASTKLHDAHTLPIFGLQVNNDEDLASSEHNKEAACSLIARAAFSSGEQHRTAAVPSAHDGSKFQDLLHLSMAG